MHLLKSDAQTDRRGFFKKSLALIFGGVAALLPVAAAIRALTDPLRRKTAGGGAVRITSLDALLQDGVPRKFPVFASRTDAWNKFVNVPVGAVYLRRMSDGKVEALNVVCPHAGCFVDYSASRSEFVCPCHNSSFKLGGQIANPASPSPRALDSLPVEIRPDGSVWVTFQNFQAGRADKVPVA